MGQVPDLQRYCTVGNGKLARHLNCYLDLLGASFSTWSRQESDPFHKTVEACNIVLLAISDSQIANFVDQNQALLKGKTLIHFSGALSIEGVIGLHPLMTFHHQFYSLAEYQKVTFVTDTSVEKIKQLFPLFINPFYPIKAKDKARYHALCVASGNLPVMLWQECRNQFSELGIDADAMNFYLEKTLENFLALEDSLTGPFVRKDELTLKKNMQSLEGQKLFDIYRAFYNKFYQNEDDSCNRSGN